MTQSVYLWNRNKTYSKQFKMKPQNQFGMLQKVVYLI